MTPIGWLSCATTGKTSLMHQMLRSTNHRRVFANDATDNTQICRHARLRSSLPWLQRSQRKSMPCGMAVEQLYLTIYLTTPRMTCLGAKLIHRLSNAKTRAASSILYDLHERNQQRPLRSTNRNSGLSGCLSIAG